MGLADVIAQRTGHDRARAAVADDAGADPRRHDPGVLRASRSEGDRHASGALLSGLRAAAEAAARPGGARSTPGTCCARPPTRLAILSNCAGQGNMAIVMVLTSLVLSHHGHALTAIAFSHSFHAAGMFAFTIPLGWASDRYGREWVMYPGVGMALDRRAVRRLRRGLRVGHARHVPGRARLVRGQCRLDRADRRLRRDRSTAAAPSASAKAAAAR